MVSLLGSQTIFSYCWEKEKSLDFKWSLSMIVVSIFKWERISQGRAQKSVEKLLGQPLECLCGRQVLWLKHQRKAVKQGSEHSQAFSGWMSGDRMRLSESYCSARQMAVHSESCWRIISMMRFLSLLSLFFSLTHCSESEPAVGRNLILELRDIRMCEMTAGRF